MADGTGIVFTPSGGRDRQCIPQLCQPAVSCTQSKRLLPQWCACGQHLYGAQVRRRMPFFGRFLCIWGVSAVGIAGIHAWRCEAMHKICWHESCMQVIVHGNRMLVGRRGDRE